MSSPTVTNETAIEEIEAAFEVALKRFESSGAMRRLLARGITVGHYAEVMRQIFHHARENPQLQALATVYFRGGQRGIVRKFYSHASSEIGHDQLALNDLAVVKPGLDQAAVRRENPLPATTALLGFGFYQIYNLDPVGYLGYLYFLEFLPTRQGALYVETLRQIGVPTQAMSFIQDHSTIDVGHNKMMNSYIQELVKTRGQLESVVYAIRVTGELYGNMIAAAFEQADTPTDYGISGWESRFSPGAVA